MTAVNTHQHSVKNLLSNNLTILLFGNTGAGKTAQIGELAEHYYMTQKLRTRLYTADKGGWITIDPYVKLGIIEVVPIFGDTFVWINHAIKGDKWDPATQKWVPGLDPGIGMYAFEGMTSMADAMMTWMSDAASRGVNIGGSGSFSFMAGDTAPGSEKLKIGSNNMAHYSVAQQQIYDKSTQSQLLPGTVLWTAGDKRGEDDAIGGVVGPQVAGKALTSEVPRWFKYTFRIVTEVQPMQAPKHVLHMVDHSDMNAKMGAKGMANARIPLSGSIGTPVPEKIEPASLVQALLLLEKRQNSAIDEISKRTGIARP